MNEFDAAMTAHGDDPEATTIVDGCFAAGWIAALDAAMRAAGNMSSQSVLGNLRQQAGDYLPRG